MEKLKEVIFDDIDTFFKEAKIDYTNLVIGIHDNINFQFKFPITPIEYLKFAQKDYKSGTTKDLINALSNAKRSIDCLIETVLKSLGIDPHNISSHGLTFCNDVLLNLSDTIKPNSLKLFCALGFAPSFLISEVRNLRNIVEHEYKIPDESDVIRAIEISELLINNVKAKEIFSGTVEITDRNVTNPNRLNGIYFDTTSYSPKDQICRFDLEIFPKDRVQRSKYKFTDGEIVYFYFLRAMFVGYHDEEMLIETIRKMLSYINILTPPEHIKIEKSL
jgi:hypothetical protein